jgi:hypothetical protein
MAQDNMYFANYSDHLMKYDGVNLYRSGLVRWQPQVFAAVDEGNPGKIIVPAVKTATMSAVDGSPTLTAATSTIGIFSAGSRIELLNSAFNPFTIEVVDTANLKVTLNKTVDAAAIASNNVTMKEYQPSVYRYYFRLTAYDANDNVVTSATTGASEFFVSLPLSASVNLRLLGLPKFEQLNYSKVYLEVYRTKRNSVAPFYNIAKLPILFDITKPYIDVIDTVSDEALPAQPDDRTLTFLAGANLGNGLSQPPQAKYCTVTDNRLVLANIQDDPKIKIDIYGNPLLSAFNNQLFHLRKDGSSVVNDLTYELTSNSLAFTTAITNNSTATFTIAGTNLGFVTTVGNKEWVYLYHATQSDRTQLDATGWYQVQSATEVSGNTQITIHLQATIVWHTLTVTDGNNQAIGSYLTYDPITKLYTPNPTPGLNYYRIESAVPNTNNQYVVTHFHFPNRIARCSNSHRGKTGFPVFLDADYNYSWRNANDSVLYSAASRVLLRLANAINFSQSVETTPWLFANAGLDLGGQTLLLTFPENSLRTTPEIVMPASLGGVEYYGNGVKVVSGSTTFSSATSFTVGNHVKLSAGNWVVDNSPYTDPYHVITTKTGASPYTYTTSFSTSVGATTTKFPSRLVVSYPNYAEVFHRPFDTDGILSDSIVDVNPADGQEITGVFPFFSESAFGASLKSSSLIVFKSNSIYVVDVESRRAQQLESNGLGCTAPYSIAATREGIMFANEAGLYRLTRSLTVEPIGSYADRLWRQDVEKSQLDLMHGHAYGVGRKYKVSYPETAQKVPSSVLVYDYTKEDTKNSYGSWTRYTNHPTTGWCNLLEDAFFCTTAGRVYQVSSGNSKYDYADDGQAISCSVTFRALDFGDSAIRKRVLHLLVHYRIPQLIEGAVDVNTATVGMAVNLVDSFPALDTFYLDVPNKPDGLSTLTPSKQVTLRYAVRNPKSLYFQTKISDNGLHTPLQVTGLSFRVAGLGTEGITEAAQTSKQGSTK